MMRTVADVMTRTVVVVAGSAPFKEVVRAMREYRVSALPVTDPDGLVIGVVSEADLVLREDPSVFEQHFLERRARREERRKAEASVARDLMTTPAVTIGPQADGHRGCPRDARARGQTVAGDRPGRPGRRGRVPRRPAHRVPAR